MPNSVRKTFGRGFEMQTPRVVERRINTFFIRKVVQISAMVHPEKDWAFIALCVTVALPWFYGRELKIYRRLLICRAVKSATHTGLKQLPCFRFLTGIGYGTFTDQARPVDLSPAVTARFQPVHIPWHELPPRS